MRGHALSSLLGVGGGKEVSTHMRRLSRICVETGLYYGKEDMMATHMRSAGRLSVGWVREKMAMVDE
ncbi:hypothetical protein PIB30_102342, partial [Stylosanthes scabra]|nr:hypothetical protein [Stylosanthes scabra]